MQHDWEKYVCLIKQSPDKFSGVSDASVTPIPTILHVSFFF